MLEFDPDFYDQKSDIQFKLGLKTLNELNVKNGETILDIGCGTGRLTLEIAKKNPSGLVIGLDVSPKMIAKAVENLEQSGFKNVQFIARGFLQYEPDIRFDAVFSNSALHWIQKTRELHQRIYTLLKPGGRLAAQVPTIGGYHHLASYFMKPIQPLNLSIYFKNWTYPIKLTKPKTLQRVFSSIGYEDINIWIADQEISFNTPEDLLNFLKTAALVPILSQLPPEKRESYLNYLLKEFEANKELDLDLKMQRLFLKVKKGV